MLKSHTIKSVVDIYLLKFVRYSWNNQILVVTLKHRKIEEKKNPLSIRQRVTPTPLQSVHFAKLISYYFY